MVELSVFVLVFYRAYIKVRIVDDEEYEKNEVFYIEIDEPRLVRAGSGERSAHPPRILVSVNSLRLGLTRTVFFML